MVMMMGDDEPCTVVCWFRLNFSISKLVHYSPILPVTSFPRSPSVTFFPRSPVCMFSRACREHAFFLTF